MLNNRAGWLALSVLAVATLLMVFFVMPHLSPERQPVGEAINAAGREVKDAVTLGGDAARELVDPTPDKAAGTTTRTDTLPSPAPAVKMAKPSTADQRPLVIPTFDVLRVEPDGSTVIAGRAEPKSRLEVADQVQTIAMTSVDHAGEFVAIPQAPLPPGDHQLVLKATSEDGRTVISEEIATVSVPKLKGGELLAMVSKPGTASRIIAMPKINEVAKAERVTAGPTDTAAIVPPPVMQEPAMPPAQPDATGPADAATNAPAANEPAAADPQKQMETASAPAAAGAAGTAGTAPAAAAGTPELQVSAVEIEGNHLFIAGLSKPSSQLRGYANDSVIGEAKAGSDGHFVIDGIMDLPVGSHRIAVDQLDASGKAVVRVEVPFNRPAGDQIAAVATPSAAAAAPALSPIDEGAFDKLRNEVAKAFQLLQALYAGGATPSVEQVAAARSATAIALRSLAEYRLPADADANANAIVTDAAKGAMDALKALDALPRDVVGLGKGLASLSEMIAGIVGTAPPVQEAPLPQAGVAAQEQSGPKTIAQAPLTQSESASVIIRRGDTLWQISRRIYGQGVRYTTIYIANQQQISNPNRIEPGQIFGVPKDSLPDDEAEKIHRRFTRG
ncbi:LysM peptidoglycan-binding domain-containing protein [Rhizobium sp. SSA_523]|uniref:LysM peptidoglycan-binding domain-containing protein n=1 Tax=Rhizobium sp. SSA_523 TaxID=2952477 RepID=UPI002091DFBB|nr:LysM peptidoglycan-binding domain-containing protein [Rhizobium sp. SSA_523]MCO5730803.1 LysM peptidoglycan-binding domain-containing protein [Rhizobium sp. SSA_523]WKC24374.1 LysM peptidoglycan-binding domain-containing protein [Rhizobium sp. SSA_523]